jgi:2-phospho-L-lactate guanylyltransferase
MPTPTHASDPAWTLIIPVKEIRVAKTRLRELGSSQTAALAAAFAEDTVTAARGSRFTKRIVVVTTDTEIARRVAASGADVVRDEPAGGQPQGLNAALAHAADKIRRHDPSAPLAALSADLPALRSEDLDRVFTAMRSIGRWFVADAPGVGTTMVAADRASAFHPAFGADSRRDHLGLGLHEVLLPDIARLRRDVDTPADLEAAIALGVGAHTLAALATWPPAGARAG